MGLRDHLLATIDRIDAVDLAGRVRGRTPGLAARGLELFDLLLSTRDIVAAEQAWLREQQVPTEDAPRAVLQQYRLALAVVEVRIDAALLAYPERNVRAVRLAGTAASALVNLRSSIEALPE
jgi:hypothetical protein